VTLLLPCPFCEGPPVVIVRNSETQVMIDRPAPESNEDEFIEALVFCHECGAQGPHADEVVCMDDEIDGIELRAAELWNQRDARHRSMYDSGVERGLCGLPGDES
jgi:Restriction alleviation protein Lar